MLSVTIARITLINIYLETIKNIFVVQTYIVDYVLYILDASINSHKYNVKRENKNLYDYKKREKCYFVKA